MNESKFTPGPWHWDDTVWNYDPAQQAPWLVDGNDERILSGEIHCNEANARLIAAAPELLESLKRMTDMWNSICDVMGWDPEHNVQYGEAHAAIAKATGV
jgi:hypothetical protein